MNISKNITTIYRFFLIIVLLFVFAGAKNAAYGQKPGNNKIDTGRNGKDILIIHTDRKGFKKLNDTTQITFNSGNVAIRQGTTLFYCDSVAINSISRIMEAFGHVHINDNDSVNIYSDYMRYQGADRKAFLKNNVKLTDSKSTLTTTQLDYDLNTKIATYSLNGKLVSGTTVLTSLNGIYFGDTRDATFYRNVVLVDPQYTVKTDSLLYNTFTKRADFVVHTNITSGPNKSIVTDSGYYYLAERKGYFAKRPIIIDSSSTLIADEVAADDSSGFGEARGQVVYKDTAQGIVVLCNDLKSNRIQSSFLATVNPVAILKQGSGDSVFIAADTLYSARYSDSVINNTGKDSVRKTIEDTVHSNALVLPNIEQDSTRTIDTVHNNIEVQHSPKPMFKKVGKTFVWRQADSSTAKPLAPPVKSEIQKPEKKGIFGIFKKQHNEDSIPHQPLKDSVPLEKDKGIFKGKEDNSGKRTPGIIDTLKNNKPKVIDSSANKSSGIDLTPGVSNASGRKDSIPQETKASRFLEAYYNVRIYSDSMQAIGDSMYYDGKDSLFQLFKNPVVWTTTSGNQASQIIGDTIDVYTANSKPKYMKVWYNGLMISQSDTLHRASTNEYFNQMYGRTIEGWFTGGQLDSIAATGNAQSVFYSLDDNNKYINVTTLNSRILNFYFADKELSKLAGRKDISGKSYPMRQVNHVSIRLKGFQWLENKRPKSKYELLAH
ncbi:hypothetical protein A9P82_09745 [Arachidicoccus ginsenosidimutans]|uniref:OstA-like protein n=1 Tax=Arachidicoccus sp. BS20 TaxID=1850526 RepID=UPI0007F0F19B|nr:OstA-like protein [Arachidicoccus sp. BS20]ANI89548.1 hypothetical protein A9P82_09745 [Arachidicoccus sp. BS20]